MTGPAQPRMSTARIRAGLIVTATLASPGLSWTQNSALYLAPS
jgi:hypothetical protein